MRQARAAAFCSSDASEDRYLACTSTLVTPLTSHAMLGPAEKNSTLQLKGSHQDPPMRPHWVLLLYHAFLLPSYSLTSSWCGHL